jgi:hypothetical protein
VVGSVVKAVAWVEALPLSPLSRAVATLVGWTRGECRVALPGLAGRTRRRRRGACGPADADEAGAGPAAVEAGLVTCVLAPGRPKAPITSTTPPCGATSRGEARCPAHASADGRERLELQADQRRGRRDLAL